MTIEIRLFAGVRAAVGERTLTHEVEPGTTVRELLARLEEEHPALEGRLLEAAEIASSITVLRNGTHVAHFEGLATELADGDCLSITPPVTGG